MNDVAQPQKADHNAEINKLTSQLQDVHARLTETEQREKDARLDLEASQQLVKELESSLEAARLSKELEMKRLKEVWQECVYARM